MTIEGPRFSTKAESHMFRKWGADVINMPIAPEAILSNEIGIPYAAVAMSTDYDCWKEEHCTVDEIMKVMKNNNESAQRLLRYVIPSLKKSPIDSVGRRSYYILNGPIYSKYVKWLHQEVDAYQK